MQTCALLRHRINTANGAPSENGSSLWEERFPLSKQHPTFAWQTNYLRKNNISRYKCPVVVESDAFDDFSTTCHGFCFGGQMDDNRPWGTINSFLRDVDYTLIFLFRNVAHCDFSFLLFVSEFYSWCFTDISKLTCTVFAVVERESSSRLLLFFSLMNIQWVWIVHSWLDNTQKTTLNPGY